MTLIKNKSDFIKSLETGLGLKLPGQKAHEKMRIISKFSTPQKSFYKKPIPSAVLILLIPNNDTFDFILTIRSDKVKRHRGQICLPGGVQEQGETLDKTALRETQEEIGVDKKSIELIGKLTPLYVPISGFDIHPYVGWTRKTPKMKIKTEEVDKIVSIQISELIKDKILKKKSIVSNNVKLKIKYFDLGNETVWGATSMILSEFRQILKKLILINQFFFYFFFNFFYS